MTRRWYGSSSFGRKNSFQLVLHQNGTTFLVTLSRSQHYLVTRNARVTESVENDIVFVHATFKITSLIASIADISDQILIASIADICDQISGQCTSSDLRFSRSCHCYQSPQFLLIFMMFTSTKRKNIDRHIFSLELEKSFSWC